MHGNHSTAFPAVDPPAVAGWTLAVSRLWARGELHPPMLARTLATLDHLTGGRLCVNIISSDWPGTKADSATRYRRSGEVIEILKQAWTRDRISFHGEFYDFDIDARPGKPYQQNGGPLLYFGGISPSATALAAEHADVYLMWPESEANLATAMRSVADQAAAHGRTVDFGLRVHVIVRQTQAEARAAADRLISRIDPDKAAEIKRRSLHAASAGMVRQDAARTAALAGGGDRYVEPHLWTGIGLARSGCGAAIVGDPDHVYAKLQRYVDMGIRAFILSGYPHADECRRFAEFVLPRMPMCRFADVQGRRPHALPRTPLTTAPRR